ncbi:MAG: hypothetical protein IK121_01825 [Lachnospiraceae bacterium]|nr:hypothetical protein [Lachnospiraceae bacterium]
MKYRTTKPDFLKTESEKWLERKVPLREDLTIQDLELLSLNNEIAVEDGKVYKILPERKKEAV